MSSSPPSRPFHYGGKSFATPYFIQYAASGRSKCQSCKQLIRALTLRVGKIKPPVCYWYHLQCFRPPTTLLDAAELGGADAVDQDDREQVQQRLDDVAAKRTAPASAERRKRSKPIE